MSNTKISALTAATAALAADELPINEAGISKKLTVAQIHAYTFGSSLPAQPAYGTNVPFYYTATGYNCWVYYDGTRWLTETVQYVPCAITLLAGSYGTANNSSGNYEQTGLPIAGVVGVRINVEITISAGINTGNFVAFGSYNFGSGGLGGAVVARAPVANMTMDYTGDITTGGTNNRMFFVQVAYAAGVTSVISSSIVGYWAHLIAT